MSLRTARTLSSTLGMNVWPPKPGFTDIRSTRSSFSRVRSSTSSGVAGFSTRPGLQPCSRISVDGAIDVITGFGMKRNVGGAGLCEVRHDAIDGLDHQMHVERRGDAVLAQRLADQRAYGEVGHVMVVHDIEMDHVGARGEHGVHFVARAARKSAERIEGAIQGLFMDDVGMAMSLQAPR